MITPEQAFQKWWEKHKEELTVVPTIYNQKHAMRLGFNHGQQYQELHQLSVLADIRKAVGDGEGKLMQEELVKRIEGLVNPWRDIETLPCDDEYYLFADEEGGTFSACSMKNGIICGEIGEVEKDTLTHWMPWPQAPKSVTTEKEEA